MQTNSQRDAKVCCLFVWQFVMVMVLANCAKCMAAWPAEFPPPQKRLPYR
jgi:hypothetical protein